MNKHELLANIAQDYYLNQLSLAELTNKYQLSRYIINKSLDDARDLGIVTFNIATPFHQNFQLENKIKELFHVPNIYVIRETEEQVNTGEDIIRFAAERIEERIKQSQIIGTVWGGTVFDIIEHFTPHELNHLVFTQFIGENRKYKSQAGSMRMVEKAAQKFSANYLTLSGPLYITNPITRQGMLNEFSSQPALTAAKKMDLLFAGLGTLASINSIADWHNHTSDIFPDVNLGAIAGMVYGHPYDMQGNILNTNCDNVFGIDLKTILATPHRVCVVKSKFKSQAALGALRGHFFTEFIFSESVALRILSEI